VQSSELDAEKKKKKKKKKKKVSCPCQKSTMIPPQFF
jgi:hypothetical protein